MIKQTILTILLSATLYAGEVYATFDVKAMKESKLTLSVSGVVKSLHVKIGDRVKKGDTLLELNNLQELAMLALNKSEVALSKISKKHYKTELTRYDKIKDVIDEELYEKIKYAYEQANIRFQKTMKAYKLQKIIVGKTILKAPYAGIVNQKFVEIGDGVTGPGKPLLSIVNTPEVKLVLEFDEKHWNSVKTGQTFDYKVDGLDEKFVGKISKVYPTVNPKTRKLKAEVLTSDILPGLFGDGQILVD